jgi:hypothetical protein
MMTDCIENTLLRESSVGWGDTPNGRDRSAAGKRTEMLEILPGFPDQVLGIKAIGEVEDDDYEEVLVPAIEDRLTRHEKIRLLYVLGPEFEGYESDAAWEDAKLGMKTFTSYERIAVVTDSTWVRRSVKAFGWIMPGDVEVFAVDDLATARTWITA